MLASLWTTAAGFGLVALGARIDERQTWGTGLIASGLVAIAIGPTVGHIYSGKPWSAGLGLRIAGVASAAVGVGLALRCFGGCSKQDETAAGVAFFGGATMFGIGTVYEIFTAGDSLPHRPRVGISVIQTTRGSGVGVSGRFW